MHWPMILTNTRWTTTASGSGSAQPKWPVTWCPLKEWTYKILSGFGSCPTCSAWQRRGNLTTAAATAINLELFQRLRHQSRLVADQLRCQTLRPQPEPTATAILQLLLPLVRAGLSLRPHLTTTNTTTLQLQSSCSITITNLRHLGQACTTPEWTTVEWTLTLIIHLLTACPSIITLCRTILMPDTP